MDDTGTAEMCCCQGKQLRKTNRERGESSSKKLRVKGKDDGRLQGNPTPVASSGALVVLDFTAMEEELNTDENMRLISP